MRMRMGGNGINDTGIKFESPVIKIIGFGDVGLDVVHRLYKTSVEGRGAPGASFTPCGSTRPGINTA